MIVGPTNRLMIPIDFPIFKGQGINHQFYWYILAMYPINPNHIFYSVKVHPWFSSYGFFFSPSQINPFDSYENGDGCRLKMVYPT